MKRICKLLTLSLSFLVGAFNVFAVGQPNGDGNSDVESVLISYKVKQLYGLNSETSEFSPFVYENKLYFTSDREYDLVNYGEGNWTKSAYLSIFEAPIETINDSVSFGKAKALNYVINGANHTGPICMSKDGNVLYFTKVTKTKKTKGQKSIAKPKLYSASKVNGKWSDVEMLRFCREDASYGHPSISADGNTLFYATDANSKGGKDIFMVARTDDGWGVPVNLGGAINTAGNEMFPYIHEGVLYFSSDGLGGEGGMDLFKVEKVDGKWGTPENLGSEMNSPQDDFGIVFNKNGESGYFSSNREQGMGGDDIYFFNVIETIVVKTQDLAGQFRYRTLGRDYAEGLEVVLVDDDGNIIATTFTDKNGEFNFEKLPMDADYTIRLNNLDDDVELVVYGADGEPQGFLLANKDGEFVYRKLARDNVSTLALIDETDIDLSANTGTLNGQFIYEELATDYPAGMKVYLVDDDGNIIYTTTTDKYGNFQFKDLPLDHDYTIKTEENLKDYTILIYNRNGDVVAELKGNGKGEFIYRKLGLDHVNALAMEDETDVEFDFLKNYTTVYGQFKYAELGSDIKDPLKVLVFSDDDVLLGEGSTDKDGYFRLTNLPLDNNFKFKLGEPLPDEDIDLILTIYDREGEVIGYLKKGDEGYFYYRELSKDNPGDLTAQDVADVDVLAMMRNKELPLIFYEKNSSYIDQVSAEKLRQIAQIMIDNPDLKLELGSHTDARASDQYNMDLSEKRTKGVIAYLERKGIDTKARVTGKWYGETQLVNKCENGVDCPEDKHLENRRTEFKFY